MSNREIVIELLSKLPEDTPLEDIAREIEFLAGVKIAREQATRREGIPAEEARKLIDTWGEVMGITSKSFYNVQLPAPPDVNAAIKVVFK